tara:strand:+ start:1817 stop:2281 length:465 start_codon:yes stop_codon:yes gene_type:complete
MKLNDTWCFYFHDPYNTEWKIESFKFIASIYSVDDFISIFECYKDIFAKGMFFIMRENILPMWEDESNKDGGCFSYKLYSDNFIEKFFEILALMIGEQLGKDNNISKNINGISICPKKNYYIVRIWLKTSKYAIKENYNIHVPKYTTILYKNHN